MLKFNITGDKLELISSRPLNSGSKGYYIAEFTFDSDWDELIPHITIAENGTPRPDEVIIDNTYKIPTTESGVMQIGVYGLDSNGKKCISSNLVCIEVSPGAYTGVNPLPKDIWDGYQKTVLGYTERAESASADAKASADNAAKSEEKAKKFAESVTEMTVEAEGLPEGSPPTVKKSQVGDVIHLSFGIPKGEKGDKGSQGEPGKDGVNGKDGHTPQKGVDYFDGKDGKDGQNGTDGYTPKKGVDFWTEDDKAEIKSYVEEAILGGAW